MGDPAKSLLVCNTFHGNAHYCDPLVRLLDRLWPGHPEVWFITDSGRIRHPNTIAMPTAKTWTEVAYRGLLEIFRRVGMPPRVYWVHEDLMPIHPCAFEDFARIEAVAEKRDLNCVVFPTYPVPWAPEHTVEFDGFRFFKVYYGLCPYSQNQAGTWKSAHLLATCEHAIQTGKLRPWEFEGIKIADGHYISDRPWPTAYHGLFHNRLVNRKAISRVKWPEGREVWSLLFRRFLSEIPYRVRRRFQPPPVSG